jgi:hypothetical protein
LKGRREQINGIPWIYNLVKKGHMFFFFYFGAWKKLWDTTSEHWFLGFWEWSAT